MTWISGIIALLKAIPILDKWFSELAKAYVKWRIEMKDREFVRALDALIAGDQRDLEDSAGLNDGPAKDRTDVETRPRRPS
jgi:hypothetical protein